MATYLQDEPTQRSARRRSSVVITAQEVQQLFRKAWPLAERYPNLPACYSVAVAINIVRNARPPKKATEREIAIALKYARMLLRHLAALRHIWEEQYNFEKLVAEFPSLSSNLENCAAALNTIEEAERCVGDLLSKPKPFRRPPPNPAKFVARGVQKAWSSVPGARATNSQKADTPLCIFIGEALALAGKFYAQETVSDMLRGRHQRKR